ncbi:MAG TPA: sigma-70 family RNA polymerase sigma factor [Gemmataceae bacterium]
MGEILRYLRRIMRPARGDATESQLLELFSRQGDETAFESLLHRHGPMVLGVCRRVLGNEPDAEDAFQATFLILVRKAASIRAGEKLKNWLYGVACRTALEARRARAKRRAKEARVVPHVEAPAPVPQNDLRTVLDEELARLPEKYQEVILLCDLEGKGRKEVAGQLGCPEGTVASRLVRARNLLAKRLIRHGFGPSAGALTAMLAANEASAAVPSSWLYSTIKAVNAFIPGRAGAEGAVSAQVAGLVEGVMKNMLLSKLKMATAVLLALGILTGGAVALSYRAFAVKQPQANKKIETRSSGGRTPIVEVWQERAVLKDHGDLVHSVAFAPNGKLFATAGADGTVKLWETATGRVKATLPCGGRSVYSVAFSPDSKTLASGGRDGTVGLWDVATEKERATWKIDQGTVSLAFSPDGKSLAAGYNSGNLDLWDAATGKERIALQGGWPRRTGGGGISGLAMSVAFSPNGKLLAAGRYDHTVKLWNVATGKEKSSLNGHTEPVFSVSFAPDGKTLASGSGDGTVRLWDVATGKEKTTLLKDARWLLCVAFSPDGRTLAAGILPKNKDKKEYVVKLWDAKSGKERDVLTGYSTEAISSLAFSPDGKLLATTCGGFYGGRSGIVSEEDVKKKGEVRLWELVRRPAKK